MQWKSIIPKTSEAGQSPKGDRMSFCKFRQFHEATDFDHFVTLLRNAGLPHIVNELMGMAIVTAED